jgi:hypothetical protein
LTTRPAQVNFRIYRLEAENAQLKDAIHDLLQELSRYEKGVPNKLAEQSSGWTEPRQIFNECDAGRFTKQFTGSG